MARTKIYDEGKYKRIIIHLCIESSAKNVRDSDYFILFNLAKKEGKTVSQKSLKQYIQKKLSAIAEQQRKKQATLFDETKPTKK